ncbi:hypothetical protein PPL_08173 [Heterostelium album PN500]|uniref:Uncharacterized protein n=1 Tax=Heterostelium pallidum (strain ATCC 26659 / Pp 5 / PN500) TaxID=670386 RepID=D3BIT8_HETP5|nr:hypothetical protein PPL_08173 [Heterostelium album PN500]EFA78712.1 hypothetical protein PPL_08173 [Heterostelium album PN500]|eukprot:XP_020430836.1 hypothetical protein PPL_08173 [Heterostelium album PN500]
MRIKIREKGDQLFRYIKLYNLSYLHLLMTIQDRFGKSSELPLELFESSIQSIVLLPDISIQNDTDIEYLNDNDQLEVTFK